MNSELEKKVIEWASEKGILEKSNPKAQLTKTLEEVDELVEAINDDNKAEVEDAIGDVIVTLIIQAELWGLSATDCLETAYNIIAKRTGKMVDGVFVKDS